MTVSPKLSRVGPDGKLAHGRRHRRVQQRPPAAADNGDAVPLGNPYDLVASATSCTSPTATTTGSSRRPRRRGAALRHVRPGPGDGRAAVGRTGSEIYVAQFGTAPYLPGSGQHRPRHAGGKVTEGVVTGLTTPIDVAFAPDGTMYVLQYAAKFNAKKLRYVANTGGALPDRTRTGRSTPSSTKLMFPTALTFGRTARSTSTNFGNESNFGEGVRSSASFPATQPWSRRRCRYRRVHGTLRHPEVERDPRPGANVTGAAKVDDRRAEGRC